ncbi:MAG TPA: DUF2339 domain-containing protein [Polyangia bacterium]|jgi:uncharacterized membrane protein|nr:DUF2339 domain-containing protein [Polyangia bacterium]
MEVAVLFLLGLAWVVISLIVPLIALASARHTRRQLDEMQHRHRNDLAVLTRELAGLERELAALRRAGGPVAAAPADEAAPPAPAAAAAEAAPVETTAPEDVKEAAAAPPPETGETAEPPSPPPPAPPFTIPPPAPSPAPAPAPAAAGEGSLEEHIALVWLTRAGATAFLVGVAFFYKYAVDNEWIGPLGRVALGVLAGAAVLALAEYLRPRTRAIFINVVVGIGLALLYVSGYASHGLYHLVSVPVAFAAVAGVTLLGGALAMRHRSELILLFALITGFLSPVLLSTGEDRPLALFGYLWVLTALAHTVALRMGFRRASWAAVGGVMALFLGWYVRFFDYHPPAPRLDLPLAAQAGAYYSLGARLVPLGAVLGFMGQWLGVYRAARRRSGTSAGPVVWPAGMLLAAATLGQAGVGLLLPDRPLLLGAFLSGFAALFAWLFGREGRRELLGVPLAVSFVTLLFTSQRLAEAQLLPMLGLLGLWAGVYAVALLRELRRTDARLPRSSLLLVGCVGTGFAVLSALLLLERHPFSFALILTGLSLGYAALAVLVALPGMAALATALSFLGLLLADPTPWFRSDAPLDHRFIAVAAAWAAVYLLAGAYELLVLKARATPLRLLNLAAASLGFVVLALSQTGEDESLVRSLVLAVAGAVDLGLGAALLRRAGRRRASVLLGQALALLCASLAFLLSGASITVAWAAMAAVVAYLAATAPAEQEERPEGQGAPAPSAPATAEEAPPAAPAGDTLWLAGAVILFGATLMRLVTIDLAEPARLRAEFWYTDGRSGALVQSFLFNPRAYALAGGAVALWVAARALGRTASQGPARSLRAFGIAATGALVLGHGLGLGLVASECHALALAAPRPLPGLAPDELQVFRASFETALATHADRATMMVTLVMALYAAALVAIGFSTRDRTHRYLGLGLFGVTLGKLVLWDVWHLQRIYQMLVLVGVGALLLGASYLYARLGRRLVHLLRDGGVEGPSGGPGGRAGTAPLLVLLALGAGLGARPAAAFEVPELAEQRPIDGIEAPGFYRVEIDPELYRHSTSAVAPLGDLRVAGPDGREVPYLVRQVPVAVPEALHQAILVDPVVQPDGLAQAVLDLGRPGLKHSQVRLTLVDAANESGPPLNDYLRHTRVEVSNDEAHFSLLAEGGRIYRIRAGSTSASPLAVHHTVEYPLSDARYLRITVYPGTDGQRLRILAAEVAYTPAASKPLTRRLAVSRDLRPREVQAGTSELVFDLGLPGVPVSSLMLDVATPAFERRAVVWASTHNAYWTEVGGGWLYRAPAAAGAAEESLALPVNGTRKRYLRLTVGDGDDPPLEVRAAAVEYLVEELVLHATAAGPHTLYLGSERLGPPHYDLAAVLARAGDAPLTLRPARLGALGANPRHGQAAAGPKPWSERYRTVVILVVASVVALLALWTVRLLRGQE